MEIYKDLSNPASKEFEKLLNNQFTKNTIEEGKVIEGKINKITEKFVFLFIEGLKSEPVLDINELKSMGLSKNISIGETIPVLLEKIEDKSSGGGIKPRGGSTKWWTTRTGPTLSFVILWDRNSLRT